MERLRYLTLAEAQRLKESVGTNRDRAMIGIMLHTGMRIGELSALQVRDFDLEARQIRVERTVVWLPFYVNRKKGILLKKGLGRSTNIYKPKRQLVILDEAGRSKVIMPEDLVTVAQKVNEIVKLGTKSKGTSGRIVPLVDDQTWTYIQAERAGRDPNAWMWRPGAQNGKVGKGRLCYPAARDVAIRAMKRAQIPIEKCHPHVTRHTFAVHFLKNGGDVRTLQRIGGWSNITMVARYTDLIADDLVYVANRVKLGY